MAGDKNILAFANRDSLQHKISRPYGAGAVCIKDGLFYEANGDIVENTPFEEGDTGATWKLVGSKPIEDWQPSTDYKINDPVYYESNLWRCTTEHTSTSTFEESNWQLIGSKGTESWAGSTEYKVGDQVFALQAVWEATTAHTSGSSFTDTDWNLKSGLVNGEHFTVSSSGDLYPVDNGTQDIGDVSKHYDVIRGRNHRVYNPSGTYTGDLKADGTTLKLHTDGTTKSLSLGSSTDDMVFSSSEIKVNKTLEIDTSMTVNNGSAIRFFDGDSDKPEGAYLKMSGNDWGVYSVDGGTVSSHAPLEVTYDGWCRVGNKTTSGKMYLYTSGTSGQLQCDGDMWFRSGGNTWGMKLEGNPSDWRLIGNNSSSTEAYIGETDNRWSRLYVTQSTNVSSDKRYKNDIKDIPDVLLDIWFEYVRPKSYKINNDITLEDKRHCGVIAQDVIKAFEAAGLDWREWDVVEEDNSEHKYLSVSYDHIQVIEMAAIRKKLGL